MAFLQSIIVLLFACNFLSAQPFAPCLSFPGDKKVYCVGETVKAIDCFDYSLGGGNISKSDFDFLGNGGYGIPSTYIYNTPGVYRVGILGGSPPIQMYDFVTILGSRPPEFKVKICEGRKVTIVIQNPTAERYQFDFGNVAPIDSATASLEHPYTSDAPIKVNVKGQCSSYGTAVDVTPFLALVQPEITRVTNDETNKKLTLEFKAISYLKYKIYKSYNNSPYDSVASVSNTSGIATQIFPANGGLERYCFKVIAYDDCGKILADSICTIESPSATVDNTFNTISWNSDALYTYEIFDDVNLLTQSSVGTYKHENSVCGKEYYYSIKGSRVIAGNLKETIVILPPVEGESTNTPGEIENLNSTIVGSTVQLQWDIPSAFTVEKYKVLRSEDNGPFSQIGETTRNFYTDSKAPILKKRYCYKIDYIDLCGNPSDVSLQTCPIILISADISNNGVEGFKSTWNNYVGAILTPSYVLEKLDLANNVIGTFTPNAPDTTYSDINVDATSSGVRYRVKITQGTATFYSNIFTIKFEPKITAPNAFTPNGDKVNDTFTFYGKYIKSFRIYVYNRWGEMVFSTANLDEGWDGTYQNKDAIVDDYSFVIEALDNEGKQVTETGTVSLLR